MDCSILWSRIIGDGGNGFEEWTRQGWGNDSFFFFFGSSLKTVPDGLFASAVNAELFSNAFSGCVLLSEVPENLFASCGKVRAFDNVFAICSRLESVPEGLFAHNPGVRTFESAFNRSGLKVIPPGLFSGCPEVESFSCCFRECSHLQTVPASLFDSNRKVQNFFQTFCYAEVYHKGESPYTTIDGRKYHLYERYLAPDYFVTPIEHSNCLWDIFTDTIPEGWS